MTNYINWMQMNQPSAAGDTAQINGNPSDNHESPASGVASGAAPEGTNYALVWADVVTSISVTNLKPHTSGAANIGNGKTITIPANQLLEIPNIIAGQSTITMTDV